MRVLIISPVKPFPLFQGNSARVNFIYQNLKERGHYVSMLYYGMEGGSSDLENQFRQYYDSYIFVPSKIKTNVKSKGQDYGLDDWSDKTLGPALRKFILVNNYDCVIVNYVWFSWVLEFVPNNVIKIIDTHDRFGGRRLDAEKIGLEPNWFYTTVEDEQIGLSRADVVIAITDEERDYFKKIGVQSHLQTIGYFPKINKMIKNNKNSKSIFGYVGSSNPWNVNSIQKLVQTMKLPKGNKLLLAGTISKYFPTSLERGIISVGSVDDLSLFFSQIGYFINPMIGSTGLKIKTIDSMAHGCPVIGLPDSFSGLIKLKENYWGCFKNMKQLCQIIPLIKERDIDLDRSEIISFYNEYKSKVIKDFNSVFGNVDD